MHSRHISGITPPEIETTLVTCCGSQYIQNAGVASLVLLNAISPSKLADDLILAGRQVWEALA